MNPYRQQLSRLMAACGEDLSLRQAVRRAWVLRIYAKSSWASHLDPTPQQVSRMAKRILEFGDMLYEWPAPDFDA